MSQFQDINQNNVVLTCGRQIDQWNRIEHPEIFSYGLISFNKDAKAIRWWKESSININRTIRSENCSTLIYVSYCIYTKINSKCS